MTIPDPITTARIAIECMAYHDRYCVKIGKTTINTRYDGTPTGSPVTFTFRADARRAAYIAREAVKIATAGLSAELEKLKAALEVTQEEGLTEIRRLTNEPVGVTISRDDARYLIEMLQMRGLVLPEPYKSKEGDVLSRLAAAIGERG